MVKCEWKKLYSHKKGEKDDVNAIYNNYYWNQSGFKELMEACEGKNNLMILIKGKQGVKAGRSARLLSRPFCRMRGGRL